MEDFPLIKSLQEKDDKTPLPRGHKYVEYEVIVEGEKMTVHIPEKESATFEEALGGSERMDKYSFSKIMRSVRGIRG